MSTLRESGCRSRKRSRVARENVRTWPGTSARTFAVRAVRSSRAASPTNSPATTSPRTSSSPPGPVWLTRSFPETATDRSSPGSPCVIRSSPPAISRVSQEAARFVRSNSARLEKRCVARRSSIAWAWVGAGAVVAGRASIAIPSFAAIAPTRLANPVKLLQAPRCGDSHEMYPRIIAHPAPAQDGPGSAGARAADARLRPTRRAVPGATGDRVPVDGGEDGFAQGETRGAEGPEVRPSLSPRRHLLGAALDGVRPRAPAQAGTRHHSGEREERPFWSRSSWSYEGDEQQGGAQGAPPRREPHVTVSWSLSDGRPAGSRRGVTVPQPTGHRSTQGW